MTRVTFLHGADHRLKSAVGWLAKRHAEGGRVVVFAPDAGQAELLDRLLWTHGATGFLPHCRVDSPLAAETPILIAQDTGHVPTDECLLNLSNEVPPNFAQFLELVEIISRDDEDRLPGRDRFRFYRDRGYPMDNTDISRGL